MRRWRRPALRRPALVLLAAALAFLDAFTTAWPGFRGTPLHVIGGNWNWSGKLLDFAVLVAVAALFVVTGLFTRQELGATVVQRPGAWVALLVMALLLVLDAFAVWKLAPHEALNAETIGYQLTMPGLTEELYFRGLLLALFDRMFVPTRTILGAKMGYGAIATSLAFGAVHMVSVNRALHVDFEPVAGAMPIVVGFVLVWIRARSGSLVLPVVFHSALNAVAHAVPALV